MIPFKKNQSSILMGFFFGGGIAYLHITHCSTFIVLDTNPYQSSNQFRVQIFSFVYIYRLLSVKFVVVVGKQPETVDIAYVVH